MTIQQAARVVKDEALQVEPHSAEEPLNLGLKRVGEILYDVVDSDITVLRDASHHILDAGGKRVRPRMAILSYLAAGGEKVEDVAEVAAAVELVHTASVVHDDINDHGVVRRGKPSINSIWGRTFALLTGDYLFTKVYELMAPYKDLNIVLAEATVALVEGETLQAAAVKENRLSREVYAEIIALKTAALFKAAAKLGGLMADADEYVVERLGEFGYKVGLAFQIVDDVLDLTADDEQLGKTAGIDLEQGRGYAAAYMVENGDGEKADPMENIKQKMLEGNAIEEARQKAQMLVQSAIQELDFLDDTPQKRELANLAHMVIDRDF